jgi:hypothetical protein
MHPNKCHCHCVVNNSKYCTVENVCQSRINMSCIKEPQCTRSVTLLNNNFSHKHILNYFESLFHSFSYMHDLVCSLNFPFEYNGILPDVTPMHTNHSSLYCTFTSLLMQMAVKIITINQVKIINK